MTSQAKGTPHLYSTTPGLIESSRARTAPSRCLRLAFHGDAVPPIVFGMVEIGGGWVGVG